MLHCTSVCKRKGDQWGASAAAYADQNNPYVRLLLLFYEGIAQPEVMPSVLLTII